MVNTTNKTISFFLSALLSLVSWGIIIVQVVLSLATLFNLGLSNVDIIGFTLTTILVTIYTIVILFKVSNFSYFPLILILLHMATLNGSTLAIIFIIIDLIILILLNTGTSPRPTSQTRYYYTNSQQSGPFSSNENTGPMPKHTIDDDNVFDAEYHTKE